MGHFGETVKFKKFLPMIVAAFAILMAAGTVSHAEGNTSEACDIVLVSGAVLEGGHMDGAVLEEESSDSAALDALIEADLGYHVESMPAEETAEDVTEDVSKAVTGNSSMVVLTEYSLNNCTIKMEYTEVTGDGSQKTPKISVFYKGSPLSKNKDYTVTYSNNVNAGVAEVVIKGINDWNGTVSKTFTIKYSAVKDLAYVPTSGMISLTWDKMANVAGYEVFRSTSSNGTYTKLASVTTNAYTDKNVSYEETYFYKVRAYGTINGGLEYGAYSSALEVSAGEQIAAAIIPYQGVKYVYGGNSSKGWDCSGFTQWIMKNKFGVEIPRTTKQQVKVGEKVNVKNQDEWLPGDLIFFSKGGSVCHVALYIGDGKMMHASSTYKKTMIVEVDDYNRRCTENKMTHVRRVL